MKNSQNLTYANLREAWLCYLMFKSREITGKIGFQFCKLFHGLVNKLFGNLLEYKENTKNSVCIKFGKGLLKSCILDSVTSVIECR